MDMKTYLSVSEILHSVATGIANAKRPAYTIGSDDVLRNFKSVAERIGVTPMQVWAVYFLKHIDAISALAKSEAIPQAEAIEGRFADALNYLDLGYALYKEKQNIGVATIVPK